MNLKRYKNVGKKVGDNLYFHKKYWKEYIEENYYSNKNNQLPKNFKFNILKYNLKTKKISFLFSPDFNTSQEPYIKEYITINDDKQIHRVFSKNLPIYHHKWMMVCDNYKNFNINESINRSKYWIRYKGLMDIKKIGFKKYWEEKMTELEELWDEKQQYTSAKTSQNILPSPVKKLIKNNYWKSGMVNLDIGGGRFDKMTDYMKKYNISNLVYDPFNRTPEHNKKIVNYIKENEVDTVTLFHILNVIKEEKIQLKKLKQAYFSLKKGGVVFIYSNYKKVNRKPEKTMKNCFQNYTTSKEFISLIKKVFPNVYYNSGLNMVIATKP